MSQGLGALPSAAEFDDFAEAVSAVVDEVDEDLTLEEVLELFAAICSHPVAVFLRRACDLVPGAE